jgi:hypothetical protein
MEEQTSAWLVAGILFCMMETAGIQRLFRDACFKVLQYAKGERRQVRDPQGR